jgi:UDP-N-acetylglucosamine 2-epimerase (non-hydrolysing)
VIAVVYGTTGELIKLAPVLIRLRDRGLPYLNVTTGQQVRQIPPLLDQLELPQPDLWLGRGANGSDLESNRDIPGWLTGVVRSFARNRGSLRRRLRAEGTRPLVLVHGDTMTTLLGTLMGRAMRLPVAHIEAGVRTWDLLHPFPEEATRRLVSRVAQIHYAPGPEAARNLRRGAVVDTGMNTIRDSILLCPPALELPEAARGEPFGVVSLHRYELLRDERLLRETLQVLAEHSRRLRLLFVDHPVTVAAVRRFGLDGAFDERFRRVARLDFFTFVALLRASELVVTDSGGSQLEAYVLDKPCLVHRKAVEQPAGVGENVVVSGLRIDALRAFLAEPQAHRRRAAPPDVTPSDVIVQDLQRRGFVR